MSRLSMYFATTLTVCSLLFMPMAVRADDTEGKDMHLKLELVYGDVIIELFPEKAPEHVHRLVKLTKEGFYDGIVFHRVIDGFMAQTGDPTGTGAGGSNYPDLKAEFNTTPHARGIVSMARSGHPDSANSQFFIVLADAPHLDNQYTAFGKVISGMEFVDKIKKGAPYSGAVTDPDKIVLMKVHDIEGDVKPHPEPDSKEKASQ